MFKLKLEKTTNNNQQDHKQTQQMTSFCFLFLSFFGLQLLSICLISFISLVYFFVSGEKNKNLSNGQRLKTSRTINGHKTMKHSTSSLRMFSFLLLLLQICSCAALNVCTCSNGVKATGTGCTTNGANICASCDSGYLKDGNSCTLVNCNAGKYKTGSR